VKNPRSKFRDEMGKRDVVISNPQIFRRNVLWSKGSTAKRLYEWKDLWPKDSMAERLYDRGWKVLLLKPKGSRLMSKRLYYNIFHF